MRFIAHPHPRGIPGSSISNSGATPTRSSTPSCVSTASDSSSASASATATSTSYSSASADYAAASPTDHLHQSIWQEQSHIPTTLQLKKYGFYVNGNIAPGAPASSEDESFMQRFMYIDHLLETSNYSVVARCGDVVIPCTSVQRNMPI